VIPAAPAPPPAAEAPAQVAPAAPLSATVVVTCQIAPGGITRDCAADPDPGHPGAAEAALASLQAHPLRLPGTRQGQSVAVGLIRANLGKAHAFGLAPARPYEPDRIGVDPSVDLARYYPDRAVRMSAQGQSLVRCKVTDDGRLDECWVRGEAPAGYGFGVAELVLATQVMRATSPGPDAPAYDWRTVDVPIAWSLPSNTPPPPASP